jgi:uncharacterized protein YqeY
MSLKLQITEEMKTAMRAQDKTRLTVIRLILAAIKQKEVDERIELTDAHILSIFEKMIKQRRESIEHFEKAGRQELVDQENFEINLIQTYMPKQLSEEEIESLIAKAVLDTQAKSMQDMGKLMAVLKPELTGKADMNLVSKKIKEKLSS